MTKRTASRARLLRSVVCLALCLGLLVGTTFAWFSDEASTGKTTITAGNLDIQFQQMNDRGEFEESDAAIFDEEEFAALLWEPGVMEVSNVFTVYNAGNLYLEYLLTANEVDANSLYEFPNIYWSLTGVIKMVIVGKDAYDAAVASVEGLADAIVTKTATYEQRLALWSALQTEDNPAGLITEYHKYGTLAPGDCAGGKNDAGEIVGQVAVLFWEEQGDEIDNKYNASTGHEPLYIKNFGLNVFATQYAHEEDSFGSGYDAGIVLDQENFDKALEEAKPGDTIPLSGGEFTLSTEDLAKTSGLTFVGSGQGETVLVVTERQDPNDYSKRGSGLELKLTEDETAHFKNLTIDGSNITYNEPGRAGGVISVRSGGTVEFDHVTMVNGNTATYSSSILVTGSTHTNIVVKDCNISGAFRGVFFCDSEPSAPHSLLIENSIIEAPYPISSNGVRVGITVRDSTLQGGTSYDTMGEPVLFENVTFSEAVKTAVGELAYSVDGQPAPLNRVFAYNDTTFRNCKFLERFWICGREGNVCTINFEGCLKGTTETDLAKVTSANVKELFTATYFPGSYVADNANVHVQVDGVDANVTFAAEDVADRPGK